MPSEFDAFIAQETLVPFEGLTWQFLRCRIQPYDDINWNGGPKTCVFVIQILRRLWSFYYSDDNQIQMHLRRNTATAQCLKITQNVASEFFNFGIFQQFLTY